MSHFTEGVAFKRCGRRLRLGGVAQVGSQLARFVQRVERTLDSTALDVRQVIDQA